MARKRKGTPVDPAFALFQSGAPEWHEDETADQNKDKAAQNKGTEGAGYDVAMKALQDQIAMLRETQQRNARASSVLMSQVGGDQPPRVITEMNLENLPDPVTDPQGYAKEIAKRGADMLASQRNYDAWVAQKQKQSSDALETVWNNFSQAHPEYASHTKLVQAAASSAISAARARGIDPNKYVVGDTENFFEDVMKEMRDMAGGDTIFKADTEDGDETDDTGTGGAGATTGDLGEADDEDPDRTAGVFGGQDSGGRPNPSAKPLDVDMFKDIREFQQKNGWHL
jgi:hypothetical protein